MIKGPVISHGNRLLCVVFARKGQAVHLFIAIVSLLGDWLLFSFPLFQGLMELQEYQELLDGFDQISKNWSKISPWWWLVPSVKIKQERQRGYEILRQATRTRSERRRALSFLDQATAWYYVSVAGWLKMISSAYELLETIDIEKNIWLLILLVVALTAGGLFNAYYRINRKRIGRKEKELKPDSEVIDE